MNTNKKDLMIEVEMQDGIPVLQDDVLEGLEVLDENSEVTDIKVFEGINVLADAPVQSLIVYNTVGRHPAYDVYSWDVSKDFGELKVLKSEYGLCGDEEFTNPDDFFNNIVRYAFSNRDGIYVDDDTIHQVIDPRKEIRAITIDSTLGALLVIYEEWPYDADYSGAVHAFLYSTNETLLKLGDATIEIAEDPFHDCDFYKTVLLNVLNIINNYMISSNKPELY